MKKAHIANNFTTKHGAHIHLNYGLPVKAECVYSSADVRLPCPGAGLDRSRGDGSVRGCYGLWFWELVGVTMKQIIHPSTNNSFNTTVFL